MLGLYQAIMIYCLTYNFNKLKIRTVQKRCNSPSSLYFYIFYFAALPRVFEASSTNFLKTLSAAVVTSFLSTASKV